MVVWCTVRSYDTLSGCHLGVSVSVSTKNNKALTSERERDFMNFTLFLLFVSPSLLLSISSLRFFFFFWLRPSVSPFIIPSVSLCLCFVPLTITLRSCAANKSSRPSKWHLNVNAASDVPKPSTKALCHFPPSLLWPVSWFLCVNIVEDIHMSVSSYINRWEQRFFFKSVSTFYKTINITIKYDISLHTQVE